MVEVYTVSSYGEGSFTFLKRDEAEKFSIGKDEWGGKTYVATTKIYESAQEAESYIVERNRKSGLDKLSYSEKKALGLE